MNPASRIHARRTFVQWLLAHEYRRMREGVFEKTRNVSGMIETTRIDIVMRPVPMVYRYREEGLLGTPLYDVYKVPCRWVLQREEFLSQLKLTNTKITWPS